mmetsp:Transcript_152/g.388  ORF Transcript_152/g.388 Transcript_152/m.388 type:complete len:302 (-) Transcript_152:345-1250(-)|eukprot:jgi/Tetstr1/439980/TSEL_003046.t1
MMREAAQVLLYEQKVPATWENLRQVFLRRACAQELATLWTAHSSAHPELAPGLTGAYVRVHTAGDSSSGVDSLPEAIGGRFHVLQVRNIRANDGSVQLELECLRSPVRLELLSDSLPTDLEIRELQERIARRKISALSEGCLRDTLTQLAVLFHCQLVAHHTPAELTLAASVPAMTAEIRATVDEQRRRALAEARAAGDNHGAKGRKAENGRKRKAGQCKELTSNVARERASTRPLRTVRLGADREKPVGGEQAEREDAVDDGHPSSPTQRWTERQPLQRFMKVRKMVSLNELMRTAPAAP